MLKKTFTIKDLDGNPYEEEWLFNLDLPEAMELEFVKEGVGLSKMVEQIEKTGNGRLVMDTLQMMIEKSVGKRHADNRQIDKDGAFKEFKQKGAYAVLFNELCMDADKAVAFFNAVFPEDLAKAIEEAAKNQGTAGTTDVPLPADEPPAWIRENRDPTQAEFRGMTQDQVVQAFKAKEQRTAGAPSA